MLDQGLTEAAPCEAADENPVPWPVEEEPQTKVFQVQLAKRSVVILLSNNTSLFV